MAQTFNKTAQLATVVIFTLIAAPTVSQAQQVTINNRGTDFIARCMSDAIARNDVERTNGTTIEFTCYGNIAKSGYEALRQYQAPIRVEHQGIWELIRMDPNVAENRCGRKLEEANRKPVDRYFCAITSNIGQFADF